MAYKPKRKPCKKGGSSKAGAAEKLRLFLEAYLTNGRNATQAAIKAGYASRSAHVTGHRLLRQAKAQIDARSAQVLAQAEEATGISAREELARLALASRFDPRSIFNPDGSMKELHEYDDEAAAGIDKVEFEALVEGAEAGVADAHEAQQRSRAKNAIAEQAKAHVRKPVVQKIRVATISRTQVREQAMKHLGLFEADNRQKAPRQVNVRELTVSLDFTRVHPRATVPESWKKLGPGR